MSQDTHHHKPIFSVVTLILLCIGLYANSLGNGFVWDDWLARLHSSTKSLSYIPHFFLGSTPYPLSATWQTLNFSFWGEGALGFHATNILLHSWVTVLVFFLFRSLLGSGPVPFWTAFLFAIHPVHTEAVSWVSGHPELLYTLFYLASLLLAMHAKRLMSIFYFLSVAAFLGAMMAKPVAVTLPVLLLTILLAAKRKSLMGALAWILPYLGVAVLWLRHIQGHIADRLAGSAEFSIGSLYPLQILPAVSWRYLRSYFWPVDLSIQHDFTLLGVHFLVLLFFLFGVATGLLWKVGRRPWAGLGLVWAAITLAPMLNWPFASASIYADRYLYLPSVGLSLTTVILFRALSRRIQVIRRPIWVGSIVVFSGLLMGLTLFYSEVWGDERRLYARAIESSPKTAFRFLSELGTAYARKGEFLEAEAAFKQSVQLNPNHAKSYNNIAWICIKERRWDEGIHAVKKAIQLEPGNFIAYNNLGNLLLGKKTHEKAEAAYLKAVQLKPDFSSALYNLGFLYHHRMDRPDLANDYYEKALRANPYQGHARRFLGDLAYDRKEIQKRLEKLQTLKGDIIK
jgi:protein O-mannosyl-transferase